MFSACSETCGDGTKTRTCSDPAPAHGGAECPGAASDTCNEGECPIDGGWTSWSTCDISCGDGRSTRECTNPAPAHNGADCSGDDMQDCYEEDCLPVNFKSWNPNSLLNACEGDCDGDEDCAQGLVCFNNNRNMGDGTSIPGCSGSYVGNSDFCLDPSGSSPT